MLIESVSSSSAETIHNPQHYVRDFYFFKRTQYPQLELVHKKPAQAYHELQKQCLGLKFVEMGKVSDCQKKKNNFKCPKKLFHKIVLF